MAIQSALHEVITNVYSVTLSDPLFRLTVESHRPFFMRTGNFEVKPVDDHLAYKYRHDLQGYLTATKIRSSLHYAVMLLNNMTSPSDFTYARFKNLIIPTDDAMKEVIDRYRTRVGGNV